MSPGFKDGFGEEYIANTVQNLPLLFSNGLPSGVTLFKNRLNPEV